LSRDRRVVRNALLVENCFTRATTRPFASDVNFATLGALFTYMTHFQSMKPYTEKKFAIGELAGLSARQLEIHLGLYAGYVKHVNLISERIEDLKQDAEKNAYLLGELKRRLGFEFDGMRMHEYYFESFENGAREPTDQSSFAQALSEQFGSFDLWQNEFKAVGLMRGIGWAVLYHDPRSGNLVNAWVGDHELGQLAGLDVVIAMDMWEHAYMVDYTPAEKQQYIDAFFKNLNWGVVESRFA
jgi:Fe-Mn family superoxide dismutase